jgi:nitrate reductase beta subunit
VYELAVRHRVALPLHPEYRTLPMVWYIPPLSPVADVVNAAGYDADKPDNVFATIDSLRIPIDYLANLFSAGDSDVVRTVLRKLAAVRAIQRAGQLGLDVDENLPASVGASADDLDDLYRLLAIAKYEQRYVIPPAHAEEAGRLMGQHEQLFCSLDTDGGPGMGGNGPPGSGPPGSGPHGIAAYRPTGSPTEGQTFRADDGRTHFNLVGWNGKDDAPNLFPEAGPA